MGFVGELWEEDPAPNSVKECWCSPDPTASPVGTVAPTAVFTTQSPTTPAPATGALTTSEPTTPAPATSQPTHARCATGHNCDTGSTYCTDWPTATDGYMCECLLSLTRVNGTSCVRTATPTAGPTTLAPTFTSGPTSPPTSQAPPSEAPSQQPSESATIPPPPAPTSALSPNQRWYIGCGWNVSGRLNDSAGVSSPNSEPSLEHWYYFQASTAGAYRFSTCGSEGDSVLGIYRSYQNRMIGQCDDSNFRGPDNRLGHCVACTGRMQSANPIVTVELNQPGEYWISIEARGATSNLGAYVLSLECAEPTTPPTSPDDCCYEVACGSVGRCQTEPNHCARPDALHEVRCCSDTAKDGWTQLNELCPWIESDVWGECQRSKTHPEATAFCTGVGGRLCTQQELENRCVEGTGCNFNANLLWSSTGHTELCTFAPTRQPSTSPAPSPSPSLSTTFSPWRYTATPTADQTNSLLSAAPTISTTGIPSAAPTIGPAVAVSDTELPAESPTRSPDGSGGTAGGVGGSSGDSSSGTVVGIVVALALVLAICVAVILRFRWARMKGRQPPARLNGGSTMITNPLAEHNPNVIRGSAAKKPGRVTPDYGHLNRGTRAGEVPSGLPPGMYDHLNDTRREDYARPLELVPDYGRLNRGTRSGEVPSGLPPGTYDHLNDPRREDYARSLELVPNYAVPAGEQSEIVILDEESEYAIAYAADPNASTNPNQYTPLGNLEFRGGGGASNATNVSAAATAPNVGVYATPGHASALIGNAGLDPSMGLKANVAYVLSDTGPRSSAEPVQPTDTGSLSTADADSVGYAEAFDDAGGSEYAEVDDEPAYTKFNGPKATSSAYALFNPVNDANAPMAAPRRGIVDALAATASSSAYTVFKDSFIGGRGGAETHASDTNTTRPRGHTSSLAETSSAPHTAAGPANTKTKNAFFARGSADSAIIAIKADNEEHFC